MAKYHDELMSTLTEEQKVIFEKFDDCWVEYLGLAERTVFVYSFKLAAKFAAESLFSDDLLDLFF